MEDKFRQDLTQGAVGKRLVKFAVPFLLSNLLQAFYSVVDMIIVGRLCGTDGITGVNIGSQINILVAGTAFGLAVGGTALVAQYGGAKKHDEQRKTIGTLIVLYMILGVLFTAVTLLIKNWLLKALKTPPVAYNETESYYKICMSGLVFIFAYNVISAVLRGMGDSKRPLYFVAVATVCNVVGDLILVGPFKLGAAGAALATVAAQAVAAALALIYLVKSGFFYEFSKNDFKIDWEKTKTLLKLGIPASVQQILVSFSFLTLTTLINSLPNANVASACQGIGSKVNSFAILPALAMGNAVSSMTAQNIGAGEIERAKKTTLVGIGAAFAISAVVFIVVEVFTKPIVSLFDSNPEVIRIGSGYLRYIALDYLFVPAVFCINGLAAGAGYTSFALFNAVFSSIIIRIPLAFFMVKFTRLGFNGVGLAIGLAAAASVVVGFVYFASGKWKKPKIKL